MSTQSNSSNESSLPEMTMNELGGMGSEGGFDADDVTPELRFSGFVSLLLGLLSWFSILVIGAIVVPVLAVLAGLVALRPSRFGKPVGQLPAKIGICLAVGFGVCGYMVPFLKTRTLGNQAKAFAMDYIDVVNAGYDTLGVELLKDKPNRFTEGMPLSEFYENNEAAQESLQDFNLDGGNNLILSSGPDAKWVLDRPMRVFRQYDIDRAHLVFRNEEGTLLEFHMHYLVDQNDVGQWHVKRVAPYRELIVAESVL
jgi:hypothetical protein